MIQFTENTQALINLSEALLTPVIAILGIYVAWRQWVTQEQKRQQDLFEKRFQHLFSPICNYIQCIVNIKHQCLPPIEVYRVLKEAHNQFIKNFHQYRFLISEQDALDIEMYFKKLRFYCENNFNTIGQINPDEFDKNMAYLAGYIERILSKYLRIETNSNNIYGIIKQLFLGTITMFLPIRLQNMLNKKFREISVRNSIESAADEYEKINKSSQYTNSVL